MSLYIRLLTSLMKHKPNQTEQAIRDEIKVLEDRVTNLNKLIRHANYQLAKKLAVEMRAKLHERLPALLERIRARYADPETFKSCRHLKGGQMGPAGWAVFNGPSGQNKDYNVSDHIFPDGRREIKCLNCRRVWTPKSPDWSKALEMADWSTNKQTKSETFKPIEQILTETTPIKSAYKHLKFASKTRPV